MDDQAAANFGIVGRRTVLATGLAAGVAVGLPPARADSPGSLLNASFSTTVQLFADYDRLFAAHWQKTKRQAVSVHVSHGGSGAQARAIIEGLPADIATLALAYDIDALAKAGLVAPDWASRLPHGSSPYASAIVFLVRAGNPKRIHDWSDLIRAGVSVVMPNPKTSGGARLNILAAWAWALKAHGGDPAKARAYLKALLAHVPVLDPSARNATLSFTRRDLGDVLIAWESEAHLAIKEAGSGRFEIVTPSISLLAEPPVTVIDKVVERHGTRLLADAYLRHLYSPSAQELIARNFFRPRDPKVAAKFAAQFKPMSLVTVNGFYGGWEKAQAKFFADGGIFDQVYGQGR